MRTDGWRSVIVSVRVCVRLRFLRVLAGIRDSAFRYLAYLLIVRARRAPGEQRNTALRRIEEEEGTRKKHVHRYTHVQKCTIILVLTAYCCCCCRSENCPRDPQVTVAFLRDQSKAA